MRPVSFVSSAICRWWINSLVPRPIKSTVVLAMTRNLLHGATAAARCSEQVSKATKLTVVANKWELFHWNSKNYQNSLHTFRDWGAKRRLLFGKRCNLLLWDIKKLLNNCSLKLVYFTYLCHLTTFLRLQVKRSAYTCHWHIEFYSAPPAINYRHAIRHTKTI